MKKITLPQVGQYIKVNRSAEKFWLEVVFVDSQNRMVTGIVDNDLLKTSLHGLKYKDVLTVHALEIIEVLPSMQLC